VDVIAVKHLACGEELLLDYGVRPLQDFIQGYGFIPCDVPHEVARTPILSPSQCLPGSQKGKPVYSIPGLDGRPFDPDVLTQQLWQDCWRLVSHD